MLFQFFLAKGTYSSEYLYVRATSIASTALRFDIKFTATESEFPPPDGMQTNFLQESQGIAESILDKPCFQYLLDMRPTKSLTALKRNGAIRIRVKPLRDPTIAQPNDA